jgi:hypothetical protein
MAAQLETYRVEAYNTARQSENKMHDDTGRAALGFRAGWCRGSTSWPT